MCDNCDDYDVTYQIQSPGQLIRVVSGVKDAVRCGRLVFLSFYSDRDSPGQPEFMELSGDLLPDLCSYYFECSKCKASFGLVSENYHGSGGYWKKLTEGVD